ALPMIMHQSGSATTLGITRRRHFYLPVALCAPCLCAPFLACLETSLGYDDPSNLLTAKLVGYNTGDDASARPLKPGDERSQIQDAPDAGRATSGNRSKKHGKNELQQEEAIHDGPLALADNPN